MKKTKMFTCIQNTNRQIFYVKNLDNKIMLKINRPELSGLALHSFFLFNFFCNFLLYAIHTYGHGRSIVVGHRTFSWKWFKSLAQHADLNLIGSTWSPK